MKNRPSEDVNLYRVFHAGTDRPVYLTAGTGVSIDEADRLSTALAIDTEVKQVYWAVADEE